MNFTKEIELLLLAKTLSDVGKRLSDLGYDDMEMNFEEHALFLVGEARVLQRMGDQP